MILLHFPDQGYVIQVQKSGVPKLLGLVTPPSYCCLKPQVLCEMNWVLCPILVWYLCCYGVVCDLRDRLYEALSHLVYVDRGLLRVPVAILLLGARGRDGLAGSARLQKVRTK